MKLANAKERLGEHKIALDKLLQEARSVIAAHYAQEEDDMLP